MFLPSELSYIRRISSTDKLLSPSFSSIEKKKSESLDYYQIEKTIGEGTFGKVKLGYHIPTGEKVSIKILEKDKIQDKEDLKRISREIKIIKLLNHPNIII